MRSHSARAYPVKNDGLSGGSAGRSDSGFRGGDRPAARGPRREYGSSDRGAGSYGDRPERSYGGRSGSKYRGTGRLDGLPRNTRNGIGIGLGPGMMSFSKVFSF